MRYSEPRRVCFRAAPVQGSGAEWGPQCAKWHTTGHERIQGKRMIHLDKEAGTPLAEQMVMQLASLIREGGLPSGARLPSIRKLASTLAVSSATVVAAYDRLIARGLIESRASSGFFVAP